jgi:5'-nucleotidase
MSWTSRLRALGLLYLVATMGAASASADGGLNILLTNDDGFGAYGILRMQASLEAAGHTVFVSAPAENQSGRSGAVSAELGASVGFTEKVPGKEWAVDGTPADSVNAGLYGLVPEGVEIDLIVSGANDGENVGPGTNSSGTVGAAMYGLRRGTPAIAVSVGLDIASLAELIDCPPDDLGCLYYWSGVAAASARAGADTAAALVPQLIAAVVDGEGFGEGFGLNVNVPSGAFTPRGVRVTRSDNARAIDLRLVPDGSGGLVLDLHLDDLLVGALVGAIDCQSLPPGTIDYDSEGQAFACGYTTVSILNGNFDASVDTTDGAKDVACSLDGLATVGVFNCGGGK